jgi:large-conductance mechanosensitive channel
MLEIVFLLPTVFVFAMIALYNKGRKNIEREVDWEKNKDKYNKKTDHAEDN